jgi:hypothetical protein
VCFDTSKLACSQERGLGSRVEYDKVDASGSKGTKLDFKSPTAERRHVLCVRVGGDLDRQFAIVTWTEIKRNSRATSAHHW